MMLVVSSRCLIDSISSERGPSFKLTNASLLLLANVSPKYRQFYHTLEYTYHHNHSTYCSLYILARNESHLFIIKQPTLNQRIRETETHRSCNCHLFDGYD